MDFKNIEISRRVWLVLLVASALSVVDILGYYIDHDMGFWIEWGVRCYAVLKATVITLMLGMVRKHRILYGIGWVVVSVFILLSIVNAVSYSLYGFGVSRKLITILYETNREEVRQFLPGMIGNIFSLLFSWKMLLEVCVFVAAWFVLPVIPKRWFRDAIWVFCLSGMIYIVWFAATARWGKTNHLMMARSAVAVRSVVKSTSVIRDLSSKRRPLPYRESAISLHLAQNTVLVIGESASRDHLSLYGYPLPTTPEIDSVRDSLFVFTDAVASSTSTAENLPRILSFMNCEPGQGEWYEYPTVMNLLKAYGYSTTWLSNQERTGDWSNLSGILSSDADVVEYLGSVDSEDHLTDRYDEVLLPEFRGSLAGGDSLRFICLHLMGSHIAYNERYPKDRSRFSASDVLKKTPKRSWLDAGKAQTVAEYDNSIAYTDSILGEVVEGLSRLQEPSIMVYLSDHGENVYDDRDFQGRDHKFVRVPFFIYANKAYRENNLEVIEKLEKAVKTPFSTSDLIHTLITLTGSAYRLYDPARDILSPEFLPRTRYVDEEPFHDDTRRRQ